MDGTATMSSSSPNRTASRASCRHRIVISGKHGIAFSAFWKVVYNGVQHMWLRGHKKSVLNFYPSFIHLTCQVTSLSIISKHPWGSFWCSKCNWDWSVIWDLHKTFYIYFFFLRNNTLYIQVTINVPSLVKACMRCK